MWTILATRCVDGYMFIHDYSQDQAEQYVYTQLYFCRLCLFTVVFAFVSLPQLIRFYVLDNSISFYNVTYLFPLFPHYVADLWCE